jgi:hypothetical protein
MKESLCYSITSGYGRKCVSYIIIRECKTKRVGYSIVGEYETKSEIQENNTVEQVRELIYVPYYKFIESVW